MIKEPSHFLKNISKSLPEAVEVEVKGLSLLKKALADNDLKVPDIFEVGSFFIKMEYLESLPMNIDDWISFGENLAKFHHMKYDFCGLEYDNFIGLGPQENIILKNWGEFFVNCRLKKQLALIKEEGLEKELQLPWDQVINFLNLNTKDFSLLHGDLWSGNFIHTKKGTYLIDPAVYYGDAEVDLAMTFLFGGFNEAFYLGYQRIRKLSEEFEGKKMIYNYYHLLNHYNLFGSGYLSQVIESAAKIRSILK